VSNWEPVLFNTADKLFLCNIKASNLAGVGQNLFFNSSGLSSSLSKALCNWSIPYSKSKAVNWGKKKFFSLRTKFTISLPNFCNP